MLDHNGALGGSEKSPNSQAKEPSTTAPDLEAWKEILKQQKLNSRKALMHVKNNRARTKDNPPGVVG